MEYAKVSLLSWIYAVYLLVNARKGISSVAGAGRRLCIRAARGAIVASNYDPNTPVHQAQQAPQAGTLQGKESLLVLDMMRSFRICVCLCALFALSLPPQARAQGNDFVYVGNSAYPDHPSFLMTYGTLHPMTSFVFRCDELLGDRFEVHFGRVHDFNVDGIRAWVSSASSSEPVMVRSTLVPIDTSSLWMLDLEGTVGLLVAGSDTVDVRLVEEDGTPKYAFRFGVRGFAKLKELLFCE